MGQYKYRVVMRVSYCEVHFDFDTPEEMVQFAAVATFHLTPREDGKDADIYFEKIDVIKEAEAEAKESEEK